MDSIHQTVKENIESFPPGRVFMASFFTDLADVNTVWQVLARLENQNVIVRIARGVYYKPAYSELIGEYEAPSIPEVARALAVNFHWTIAPSGNTALNSLGLSTQVPAKWTYISDGPYRTYTIRDIPLEFKHRSNKEISELSEKSATVIQAIRAIGDGRVSDRDIRTIRRNLSDKEKKALLKESQQSTAWIYKYIKEICAEGADDV